MPALLVYTESEAIEVYAVSGPFEYERKLTVRIEIACEETSAIDDELDIIAEQVEAVLYLDHTLGELCKDVLLQGAEMSVDKDGDKNYGSLILSYQVTYHTVAANDLSELEYLNRVDVEYDLQEGVSATNPTDTLDGLSGL